jgi:hypothetical protein
MGIVERGEVLALSYNPPDEALLCAAAAQGPADGATKLRCTMAILKLSFGSSGILCHLTTYTSHFHKPLDRGGHEDEARLTAQGFVVHHRQNKRWTLPAHLTQLDSVALQLERFSQVDLAQELSLRQF